MKKEQLENINIKAQNLLIKGKAKKAFEFFKQRPIKILLSIVKKNLNSISLVLKNSKSLNNEKYLLHMQP